jgi:hypothetical protein
MKKQMFSAKSPEELVYEARKNLADAEHALPELLQAYSGNTPRVRTIHFEGLEGLKQTMEYKFEESKGGEVVGFYATSEHLPKELVEYFDEWNTKRHKLGIKMLGIAPEHASLKDYRETDAQFGREFKTVPHEQFSSQIAMDVLGSCVRIHDYKNLQGIVIENKDVAKTVREIFEMLWQRI